MDSQTKTCPKCKEEIPSNAKKCPKCQSDLRIWPARHPILTIILCLIVLFLHLANSAPKKASLPCECHTSEWTIQALPHPEEPRMLLNNVCWNNESIYLGNGHGCGTAGAVHNVFKDDLKKGDYTLENAFNQNLLSCAESTRNKKLQQVAKSCKGRWY